MAKSTTNNKANNKANDTTDNNINMALIDAARTKVSEAWSGEATAATNIASALKGYAASLDENGLGLVAIVNADKKKSKWETFEKKYGDLFTQELWIAAHKEIATLKKLYLEYYSKGSQTFEAWLQNFKLKLMLVQGSKQPTKGSETMKRRKDNRPLFNKVLKAYKDSQPAKTGASDTTKLNNKIKSATNRLSDIKELFEGIKELEKSETTKADIHTYLVEIVTQLEDNLIAVTGGE